MPRTDKDDTYKTKNTQRVELNNFDFQDVHVTYLYTVALYSTSGASLVFNVYTCETCRFHSTVHSEHVSFSPPGTCMTWTHGLTTLSDAYSTAAVLQTKCKTLVAGAWHVPWVYKVRRVQHGYSKTVRYRCARFEFVTQIVHWCDSYSTELHERFRFVRLRMLCKQSLQD